MAIIIGSQFDLKATQFNFSRDYFESVDLLNKAPITNFPDHFITNVAGTLYQLTKANGVWDDSKKTWTVSPWKKLEFGDKNALTTDSSDKLQKNGSDVTNLVLGDSFNSVNINSQTGITVNSSEGNGTTITLGEGGLKISGADASDTKVWTTSGKYVDISGLPSEGAVAAIQAKLAGIDDTVKGYVDSQVRGLASALVFKGSVSQGSDLPENPKVGDTYVVSIAGDYAGEACEVGDTIICTVAKSDETAAQWLVVQKNINGAVTKGDAQTWKGKLLVGGDGNSISVLKGDRGQIIEADANGNPTYVDSKYATIDDANSLDDRITTVENAATVVDEKIVNVAKKADDASGAAAAANKAAVAAQAAADEAKAGLENKAGKDEATADAAGLMSAADKSKLDRLREELPDVGAEVAKGLYKIATDAKGRVKETEAVTQDDIYRLGIPKMTAIEPSTIEGYFTEPTVTA